MGSPKGDANCCMVCLQSHGASSSCPPPCPAPSCSSPSPLQTSLNCSESLSWLWNTNFGRFVIAVALGVTFYSVCGCPAVSSAFGGGGGGKWRKHGGRKSLNKKGFKNKHGADADCENPITIDVCTDEKNGQQNNASGKSQVTGVLSISGLPSGIQLPPEFTNPAGYESSGVDSKSQLQLAQSSHGRGNYSDDDSDGIVVKHPAPHHGTRRPRPDETEGSGPGDTRPRRSLGALGSQRTDSDGSDGLTPAQSLLDLLQDQGRLVCHFKAQPYEGDGPVKYKFTCEAPDFPTGPGNQSNPQALAGPTGGGNESGRAGSHNANAGNGTPEANANANHGTPGANHIPPDAESGAGGLRSSKSAPDFGDNVPESEPFSATMPGPATPRNKSNAQKGPGMLPASFRMEISTDHPRLPEEVESGTSQDGVGRGIDPTTGLPYGVKPGDIDPRTGLPYVPIDVATGLPFGVKPGDIDPRTGLPYVPIDPKTGLPIDAHPGAIDPTTGLPYGVKPGDIDPKTGLPYVPIDPNTGLPYGVKPGDIDPRTGLPYVPIDPKTGMPIGAIDPTTGLPYGVKPGDIDPKTGLPYVPIDVNTGLPFGVKPGDIDPRTGLPYVPIDPKTGLPVQKNQRGINPATGLPYGVKPGDIDPRTGLPYVPIDVNTGLPFGVKLGDIDPRTGLPYVPIDPKTGMPVGAIDPVTGLPYGVKPGDIDPKTGLPYVPIDVNTGLPFGVKPGDIDPRTGLPYVPIDQKTGLPVQTNQRGINPVTGLPYGVNPGDIDPRTGLPYVTIDARTGLPVRSGPGNIDPSTGLPYGVKPGDIDPRTGKPYVPVDPRTGLPIEDAQQKPCHPLFPSAEADEPCGPDRGSVVYNPQTGELHFDIGQMLWEEAQQNPDRYPRYPASRAERAAWDGGSYGLPKEGLPYRTGPSDRPGVSAGRPSAAQPWPGSSVQPRGTQDPPGSWPVMSPRPSQGGQPWGQTPQGSGSQLGDPLLGPGPNPYQVGPPGLYPGNGQPQGFPVQGQDGPFQGSGIPGQFAGLGPTGPFPGSGQPGTFPGTSQSGPPPQNVEPGLLPGGAYPSSAFSHPPGSVLPEQAQGSGYPIAPSGTTPAGSYPHGHPGSLPSGEYPIGSQGGIPPPSSYAPKSGASPGVAPGSQYPGSGPQKGYPARPGPQDPSKYYGPPGEKENIDFSYGLGVLGDPKDGQFPKDKPRKAKPGQPQGQSGMTSAPRANPMEAQEPYGPDDTLPGKFVDAAAGVKPDEDSIQNEPPQDYESQRPLEAQIPHPPSTQDQSSGLSPGPQGELRQSNTSDISPAPQAEVGVGPGPGRSPSSEVTPAQQGAKGSQPVAQDEGATSDPSRPRTAPQNAGTQFGAEGSGEEDSKLPRDSIDTPYKHGTPHVSRGTSPVYDLNNQEQGTDAPQPRETSSWDPEGDGTGGTGSRDQDGRDGLESGSQTEDREGNQDGVGENDELNDQNKDGDGNDQNEDGDGNELEDKDKDNDENLGSVNEQMSVSPFDDGRGSKQRKKSKRSSKRSRTKSQTQAQDGDAVHGGAYFFFRPKKLGDVKEEERVKREQELQKEATLKKVLKAQKFKREKRGDGEEWVSRDGKKRVIFQTGSPTGTQSDEDRSPVRPSLLQKASRFFDPPSRKHSSTRRSTAASKTSTGNSKRSKLSSLGRLRGSRANEAFRIPLVIPSPASLSALPDDLLRPLLMSISMAASLPSDGEEGDCTPCKESTDEKQEGTNSMEMFEFLEKHEKPLEEENHQSSGQIQEWMNKMRKEADLLFKSHRSQGRDQSDTNSSLRFSQENNTNKFNSSHSDIYPHVPVAVPLQSTFYPTTGGIYPVFNPSSLASMPQMVPSFMNNSHIVMAPFYVQPAEQIVKPGSKLISAESPIYPSYANSNHQDDEAIAHSYYRDSGLEQIVSPDGDNLQHNVSPSTTFDVEGKERLVMRDGSGFQHVGNILGPVINASGMKINSDIAGNVSSGDPDSKPTRTKQNVHFNLEPEFQVDHVMDDLLWKSQMHIAQGNAGTPAVSPQTNNESRTADASSTEKSLFEPIRDEQLSPQKQYRKHKNHSRGRRAKKNKYEVNNPAILLELIDNPRIQSGSSDATAPIHLRKPRSKSEPPPRIHHKKLCSKSSRHKSSKQGKPLKYLKNHELLTAVTSEQRRLPEPIKPNVMSVAEPYEDLMQKFDSSDQGESTAKVLLKEMKDPFSNTESFPPAIPPDYKTPTEAEKLAKVQLPQTALKYKEEISKSLKHKAECKSVRKFCLECRADGGAVTAMTRIAAKRVCDACHRSIRRHHHSKHHKKSKKPEQDLENNAPCPDAPTVDQNAVNTGPEDEPKHNCEHEDEGNTQ